MATRSNLSLKEIMGVLDKSGVTGGSAFDMGQNRLPAQEAIRSEVYGRGQGVIDQGKQNYLAQLDKIAQADQKLAGVYGDPTSPLYIEHAGRRAGAIGGITNVGAKAADIQADVLEDTEKSLDQDVEESIKTFNSLVTNKKAQETETKRQETERKRAQKEAEQEVKSKTGKTTITKTQKTKYDEAGIDPNNPQIRAIWNNSPAGFQNWFIEKRATGKIKDKIIGPRELSYWRGQFAGDKVKNPAKKTTTKSKGLSADEIKQLSNIYKK